MQPYGFGQIPRLARTLVGRVLDYRSRVAFGNQRFDWSGGSCEIDHVIWGRQSVTLSGHCNTPVSLGFPDGPVESSPAGSFHITIRRSRLESPVLISLPTGSEPEVASLSPPSLWHEKRARRRAMPRAIWDCLTEAPAILSLLRTRDAAISIAIQRRLGVTEDRPTALLPRQLFRPSQVLEPRQAPAIVIPVFNGFDVLDALLDQLPDTCGTDYHLILVDDGSNDPTVLARLEAFENAHANTTLIRLSRNQGFVKAANAGMAHALETTGGHIVLLNSDVLLPPSWLSRLLAPIAADPTIASVTPASNNAEILSIPTVAGSDIPGAVQIAGIDAMARQMSPEASVVEIPTGIGFCMALNRNFLENTGLFDPAFGMGYGEEVDWCQRTRRLGGHHVAAANLFVGHHGAASFGAETRAKRRAESDALIDQRYPGFARDVRDWCRDDPLAAQRFALSVAWLAQVSDDAVPVFIGHILGGGAEAALQVEIATAFANGCPGVVLLRVGGRAMWRIEVVTPDSHQSGDLWDSQQLETLLRAVPQMKLVYSCGVGSLDPMSVPRVILSLAKTAVSFDFRVHDYLPISPSWTLLGDDGTFQGIPDPDTSQRAHLPPCGSSHRAWRDLWRQVLLHAREVTVFSHSSAALMARAFPEIQDSINYRPHRLQFVTPALANAGPNIGVLGSINQAKGAEVLQRLALNTDGRHLVVIGEVDGRFPLPPPHKVHGAYTGREIAGLAHRYGIGLWVVPSVWPETFSFVTHEALATGLPVIAFDLGAQAEAVRAAANGHIATAGPEDTAALAAQIEALFNRQTEDRFRSTA